MSSIRYEQLSAEELRLLNEKRRNRGWTWTELAEKAGISEVTVGRLVNGHRVTMGTLDAIALALLDHPARPELVALFKPDGGGDHGPEQRSPYTPLQELRLRHTAS